jgi:hydrophobe/amphiphile efflux-3 (HAE3) family protein
VALAAAGLTFGGMRLAGVSLTMASIAVLPVLLGLAVDYAIQLQSRFDEAAREGGDPRDAAVRAAGAGAPTIATAGLATAAGFLVLLVSPVPMVRGFGVLLVVGIAVAFAVALTAGFAALTALRARPAGVARTGPAGALAASWRGAGEILADSGRAVGRTLRLESLGRRVALGRRVGAVRDWALGEALARPARVLGIGLAIAVLGLVLDTQTRVVSDIQKLVPQDLPALRDLSSLQEETHVSGEIDVTVHADDVTDPKVISWMSGYQQRLLSRYGYSSKRGCGRARLCPALSLPDLFRAQGATASKERVRALLDAVPPYFSQAVVSANRRDATMAFGIRLMPLDEQQRVIEDMRGRLRPPAGVSARLAGLPVLAAEANQRVSSTWRRLLTLLVGLAAVALVLLAVFRRPERALVPLIPIALATGWSALVLFLIRIPLNPMSVTLGALVIAISTEFAVLLSERYRQERAAGSDPGVALARTYSSTGAAVLASGATAIAGFAVLVFSNIRMLRDFGLVTVVDLFVAVAGVMVVLPSVLVLAERGELAELPARALRRLRGGLPRPRRSRAAA